MQNPPDWWSFELELSGHVLDRMLDRWFSEADLRLMFETAIQLRAGRLDGRWIVETVHQQESWEIIVEPDHADRPCHRGRYRLSEGREMKNAYLNVTYRHGRAIAAYYHLPRRAGDVAVKTSQVGEGMLVDYAENGRPIGIEITEPTLLDPVDFDRLLSSLGYEPAAREDLAPLVAA